MWFWIWFVLVVATLVGAFLLGRRLWRQAAGLARELGRAGEVAAQLSERAAELEEIAARNAPDTSPTVLSDLGPLLDRIWVLRDEAAARRAARRERHRATARSWRAYWS